MTQNTGYKQLLSIRNSHSYFYQGIDTSLKYVPTEPFKALLRNFSILLRQTVEGIQLFVSDERTLTQWLDELAAAQVEAFKFDLQATDDLFFAYTQFPENGSLQLYYSSDSSSNVWKNGTRILVPTSQETPIAMSHFGTIHISLQNIRSIIEQGLDANYRIAFEARKVYWQYIIFHRDPDVVLTIKDHSSAPTTFEGPRMEMHPRFGKSFIFISEKPISLINKSDARFELQMLSGGRQETLTLPFADPNYSVIEEKNGIKRELIPIYIHI